MHAFMHLGITDLVNKIKIYTNLIKWFHWKYDKKIFFIVSLFKIHLLKKIQTYKVEVVILQVRKKIRFVFLSLLKPEREENIFRKRTWASGSKEKYSIDLKPEKIWNYLTFDIQFKLLISCFCIVFFFFCSFYIHICIFFC